jgi:hypothetical protein
MHYHRSCQQISGNLSGDIGESEIAALIGVRKLLVIQPKQVQDRGVKIVDMHRIFDHVETEFIRLAIHESLFDPPTSEPDREGVFVVIPSGTLLIATLEDRRSSKFGPENNQRLIEKTTGLQIFDEGGNRAICLPTLRW